MSAARRRRPTSTRARAVATWPAPRPSWWASCWWRWSPCWPPARAPSQPGVSSRCVGKAVPAVQGTTLDGTHFDVDQHLGQWVVIDFFGSWCAPCQAEQPELVKFAHEHAQRPDVAMVGIMYTDKKADARAFYANAPAPSWPILNDDGPTAISFGVTGVPETYVVDPNGQVVAKFEAGHHRRRPRRRDPPLRRSGARPPRRRTVTAAPTTPGRDPDVAAHAGAPWLAMAVIAGDRAGRSARSASSGPQTNAGSHHGHRQHAQVPGVRAASRWPSPIRTLARRSGSTSPSASTRARAPTRSGPPTLARPLRRRRPAHAQLDRREQPGVDHPGHRPGDLGGGAGRWCSGDGRSAATCTPPRPIASWWAHALATVDGPVADDREPDDELDDGGEGSGR